MATSTRRHPPTGGGANGFGDLLEAQGPRCWRTKAWLSRRKAE